MNESESKSDVDYFRQLASAVGGGGGGGGMCAGMSDIDAEVRSARNRYI